MSDDLISRKALLDKLKHFNDRENGDEHFLFGIETAEEIIENEPTAFDKENRLRSCETCKYNAPSEIPGEGETVCNNGESGRYEETVRPEDCCGEYKQDWIAGFMQRFTRVS